MSENPHAIRKMFEHVGSSREKLFGAVKKIDGESFLGREKGTSSIRDLLVHLMDTEDYWVGSVIMGERRQKFSPEKYEDAVGLKNDWDGIRERTRNLFSNLSEQSLAEKRTVEWDRELSVDVERILWHLIAHELHHTGQICLLVREAGHEPPEVDML